MLFYKNGVEFRTGAGTQTKRRCCCYVLLPYRYSSLAAGIAIILLLLSFQPAGADKIVSNPPSAAMGVNSSEPQLQVFAPKMRELRFNFQPRVQQIDNGDGSSKVIGIITRPGGSRWCPENRPLLWSKSYDEYRCAFLRSE